MKTLTSFNIIIPMHKTIQHTKCFFLLIFILTNEKKFLFLIFTERLLTGDWMSAIDVPVLLINNSFTVSFLL